MSSDTVVSIRSATKAFPGRDRRSTWALANPWGGIRTVDRPALDDVDLEVGRGETVGIIGPNGAGKSTLLRLVANVLAPTSGTVAVDGRVGAMIELGLGFHPWLTGRENVLCAASLLGLHQKEVQRRFDDIVAFAELEDAIDAPLREYSSGMVARLGFATATHVDADVLIVDEVLSVGDRGFQERCLARIRQLVDGGTTLLFVSHELTLVRSVCERAVLLREGRVVADGPAGRVIESYTGRRATPFRGASRDVAVEELRITSDPLEPYSPLELEATVSTEPGHPARLVHVGLSWPAFDPDVILVQAACEVPGPALSGGRYLLRGRSSPLPLSGGELDVSLTLMTRERRALARRTASVSLAGPIRMVKPMYVLEPTVEVSAVQPGTSLEPAAAALPDGEPVVSVRGLRKSFPTARLATPRALLPGRLGAASHDRTLVLEDVDLEVAAGEAVGIVGPNGAGKSTLLRCIAGLLDVDDGSVQVRGRVVPVLELGVGFQPELSGWENLEATAAMLGLGRVELRSRLDDIVASSGVGEAMDEPVKHWSSGMRARLGFALVSEVPADVLLLDELLAVGDLEFRREAVERVASLRERGTAVLFVSHNLRLVSEVCSRAIRLESGRVVDAGPARDVVERYGGIEWSGSPSLEVGSVRMHGIEPEPPWVPSGQSAHLRALVEVTKPSPNVRLELSLRDPGPVRGDVPLTPSQIEFRSMAIVTAVPEGRLADPGWYEVRVDTGRLLAHGRFHAVLSAIDSRDGSYLGETWTTLGIGAWGDGESDLPGTIDFSVDFEVEPLA